MTVLDPHMVSDQRTSLEIRPLAGNIGAEIFGPDLTQPLAAETVAEIRATLLTWKVVFFRDQHLTQAQHVAFGRQFGEPTPAHPTLPAAFPDFPEILLLDSKAFMKQEEKHATRTGCFTTACSTTS